jgi:essential nuclear protein 1
MPKAQRPEQLRHVPLAEEYSPSHPFKQKAAKKRKSRQDEDGEQHAFVDSKASRKILKLGSDLAKEEAERERVTAVDGAPTKSPFDLTSFGDQDSDDAGEGYGEDDDEAWENEEDDEVVEVEVF